MLFAVCCLLIIAFSMLCVGLLVALRFACCFLCVMAVVYWGCMSLVCCLLFAVRCL